MDLAQFTMKEGEIEGLTGRRVKVAVRLWSVKKVKKSSVLKPKEKTDPA